MTEKTESAEKDIYKYKNIINMSHRFKKVQKKEYEYDEDRNRI